jgi:probable HAF family extracellular repeat protein
MPHRSLLSPALLGTLVACALPAQAAKDTFTATIVDHPYGENFFMAHALNNRGQVVGSVALPEETWWFTGPDGHGVVIPTSTAGVVTSIGGIDDAGTAVGTWRTNGAHHAFVADASGAIVDAHPAGALESYGSGIDDAGRICGAASWAATFGAGQAFVSSADRRRIEPLGTLGGPTSNAHAVRKGVVVGESQIESLSSRAFRYAKTTGGPTDLGTFGGDASGAFGVNQRGQAVGYATDESEQPVAFITAANGLTLQALTALGPAHGLGNPSFANGIDRHGHVVGQAWQGAQFRYRAFVTGRDGQGMHDLNRFTTLHPGSWLDSAAAINDRGQIVAHDHLDEGLIWLLTPTRSTWEQELEDDPD